jgi:CubicO group peptidase (beta-lactamase class C family)
MARPTPKGPDLFYELETLIRAQSAEGKSAQGILAELGTPIVAVAVLDHGEITGHVIGSSNDGAARNVPESEQSTMNKDTIFQACSISKPITALAVIKLCQEGTLDLDAPISQYLDSEQLSWISTPKTLPVVSEITLRLLLSHTSGLSVHGFGGYPSSQLPSVEQILRGSPPANNESIKPFLLPGQKFSYSGGGFTVTQLILETHLKKPFHHIMDETVLQPLKMTRSTYQLRPSSEKNYAPAYMTGKLAADPAHHSFPESAAAGLWTTPSDLLRAVQAVQRSLESDPEGFLEKKWAEIMLEEVSNEGMALGWMAKKGEVTFAHAGGNDPGYRCYVAGYADLGPRKKDGDEKESKNEERKREKIPKDCGICVMTSSALGDLVFGKIMAAVAYLNCWPHASLGPSGLVVPFVDPVKMIDIRAKNWRGDWGPGKWSLLEEGGLFLRFGRFPPVKLIPAAIAAEERDEGTTIDLVADGLEIMLRLDWKDAKEIINIWQDGEEKILERAKGQEIHD